MTKAETIKFLVNAIFSFTKKLKVRKNYITPDGKIFVDFIGKIDDQTVSTRFICKTRRQVAYLLNHFRAAKNGVMEWVKIVHISNIKRGYVMNSKRQWKKRNRTFEFRIIKKQGTEPKKVKSAVIAKNDNTPAKVTRSTKKMLKLATYTSRSQALEFHHYTKRTVEWNIAHGRKPQTTRIIDPKGYARHAKIIKANNSRQNKQNEGVMIMKLKNSIQRMLNDIQRSTFEIGITRTGTKENKKARETAELAKDTIKAIAKEITLDILKMEDRRSEEAKRLCIIKTQLATSVIEEYEEIGGEDAKRIKTTVKDLTAYRKAYRKGLIKYDPVEQKAHHDAKKEICRLAFYTVNDYDEDAEQSAEALRKVLATGIITIGEYLHHMEYFKSMYTLNKH